jgi:phage antirepressor YoqD-like protein
VNHTNDVTPMPEPDGAEVAFANDHQAFAVALWDAVLRGIEGSPWSDFDPTTNKLLRQFGVRTKRNSAGSARGYRLEDFADAFARYTRQNPSEPVNLQVRHGFPSDGSSARNGPSGREVKAANPVEPPAGDRATNAAEVGCGTPEQHQASHSLQDPDWSAQFAALKKSFLPKAASTPAGDTNGDPPPPASVLAQAGDDQGPPENTQTQKTALPTRKELAQWVIEAEERAEAAETKVAELEPKAEFYDELMSVEGTYTWQEVAGMLGLGRTTLTDHLKKMMIVQDNLLPYASYGHHFKVLPRTRLAPYTGALTPYTVTEVTPLGVAWLRRRLMQEGVILPAKTE